MDSLENTFLKCSKWNNRLKNAYIYKKSFIIILIFVSISILIGHVHIYLPRCKNASKMFNNVSKTLKCHHVFDRKKIANHYQMISFLGIKLCLVRLTPNVYNSLCGSLTKYVDWIKIVQMLNMVLGSFRG